MNRVPFRTILEMTLELSGQTYDSTNTSLLARAVNAINAALSKYWYYAPWPELLKTELRYFAPEWNTIETVSSGDIRVRNGLYFKCISDHAGGQDPETSPAYWEAASTPDPHTIAWDQSGKYRIGKLWYASKHDPRKTKGNYTLWWSEDESGIHLPHASSSAWLQYVTKAPLFSSSLWKTNPAVAYSRYSVVFYPGTENEDNFPDTGECYVADLNIAGDQVWVLVEFPAFLQNLISLSAAASLTRNYRNEEDAIRLQQAADEELGNMTSRIMTTQRAFVSIPT